MYDTFVTYLKQLEAGVFHIILHHNADPDAICAAEAYGYLITQLNQDHQYHIYSDDINTSATRIMEELDVKVREDEISLDENSPNRIITVDTANASQLGKYAKWTEHSSTDLIVIDHHDTSELADKAVVSIIDTDTSSTCVLADKSMQTANIEPTPRIATLILSGHMYDSRRMLYGTNATLLHRFARLIELGGDFELANRVLQNDMSQGEIIARFKAAQRLKYHRVGNTIVVTSKVGAFEASAARNFIGMGADIAFVLAPKDGELRGSARALNHLSINIGEVMSQIAEEFGGSGGGHAAAAGFNIKPSPTRKIQKNIRKRFVSIIEQLVND